MSAHPFHTFDGTAQASAKPRTTGFNQSDMRIFQTHWDQHGREWWSTCEKRSGMPVGNIEPKGWSAPWMPPQDSEIMVVNPNNSSELFINYRKLAVSRAAAEEEYHQSAVQKATEEKWETPERGDYPPKITESSVGKPTKSLKLVIAAWKENPWLLGKSDRPDPRLEKFVERDQPKRASAATDFAGIEDFGPESYMAQFGEHLDAQKSPDVQQLRAMQRFNAQDAQRFGTPNLDDEIAEAERQSFEDDGTESGPGVDEILETIAAAPSAGEALEDELDPGATGGKRIAVGKQAHVARQAPRRPGQSVSGPPKGKTNRPTMAQGAAPAISSLTDE